jgi:hypothetical protein
MSLAEDRLAPSIIGDESLRQMAQTLSLGVAVVVSEDWSILVENACF